MRPRKKALFEPPRAQSGSNGLCFFIMFTSKCASRPSCMHFFESFTSKHAPRTVCFLPFGLRNTLRATAERTFSTSVYTSKKKLQKWCVVYVFTSTLASRHTGMQFLISHLTRCLRTCLFCEPTFRASGGTKH